MSRRVVPRFLGANRFYLFALAVAFLVASRQLRGQTTRPPMLPTVLPATPPTTLPRVHDPVIAREGDTYYSVSTGRGLTLYTSPDRVMWQRQGRVFSQAMPWTATTIPGSTDHYWAPDISFWKGRWHLYYSVSTFGKNRSAIGLATSPTLDAKRPDYAWRDEGVVIESHAGDDWNAIDPNLVLDENGQPWLCFGSFWSGIKLVALDPTTGKAAPGAPLMSLARRPKDTGGAIEGPFIVRHGEFYYLFVSFDLCCRGADSTYNIRVGRSLTLTGPYVDRDSKPLVEGGGTLVLAGAGRWRGPGHNRVYREGKQDFLVYHAYDAQDKGISKLRIQPIIWDEAGWPQVDQTTAP